MSPPQDTGSVPAGSGWSQAISGIGSGLRTRSSQASWADTSGYSAPGAVAASQPEPDSTESAATSTIVPKPVVGNPPTSGSIRTSTQEPSGPTVTAPPGRPASSTTRWAAALACSLEVVGAPSVVTAPEDRR